MLSLTEFHKLLIARWVLLETNTPFYTKSGADIKDLIIWPGGKTKESPNLPYLQYDLILDNRLKDWQILKNTEVIPAVDEDLGAMPPVEAEAEKILGHYKNTASATYQYSLIGSTNDKNLRQRTRDLYNYMTTDGFKLSVSELPFAVNLVSAVQELILTKQEDTERRFFFDVRFRYADNFTEDETDIGVLKSVDNPVGTVEDPC